MKIKHIFSAIAMSALMLVAPMTFTACDGDDQLDTNQYTESVSLLAFGPSPVARGGELQIVGTGLDQVQSVELPGCSPVSDITRISKQKISIIVPKTAKPGYITLHTAKGDLVSKTKISYTEPVAFAEREAFAPNPIKPGQTLTIKGSYLNLVESVIFAEDVEVSNLTKSSADEPMSMTIQVVVPAEAQTGKIFLGFVATGDTLMNKVISDNELKVVLPSVKEIANLTGKKPGDLIEQAGSDLDLVTKLTLADNEIEFAIADGKLTYTLPESTPDAAEVAMYPASGVKVVVAYIGMQMPSEVVATPNKDLRNGSEIVITGKDLDVVENISFPGVQDAAALNSKSATEIKVNCPAGFVSGEMVLNCKSGAQIPVAIETQKPLFESFENATVSMGNDVVIKGKNLDLVSKVTYAGGLEGAVKEGGSDVEITVTMPTSGVESGVVVLHMANGESSETAELTVDAPVFCYLSAPEQLLTSDELEIKAGDLITTTCENGDHLIEAQVDGVPTQYIVNGKTIWILTTEDAGFSSKLKLISDNGEIEYDLSVVPNTTKKVVAWKGMTELTWNDGGRVFVPGDAFQGVPEGAILHLCYTQKDQTWGQAQINDGWWGSIKFWEADDECEGNTTKDGALIPTEIYGWFSDGELNRDTKFRLTAEKLEWLNSHIGENGSLVIQGENLIFTQIYITWEISLETNINGDCVTQKDINTPWTFPSLMTWGDDGRFRIQRNGPSDLEHYKYKVGETKIRFYKSGTGQIQINNCNWDVITYVTDWTGDVNPIELVLTQELIDCLNGTVKDDWSNTAFVLQGDGLTIEKITIE